MSTRYQFWIGGVAALGVALGISALPGCSSSSGGGETPSEGGAGADAWVGHTAGTARGLPRGREPDRLRPEYASARLRARHVLVGHRHRAHGRPAGKQRLLPGPYRGDRLRLGDGKPQPLGRRRRQPRRRLHRSQHPGWLRDDRPRRRRAARQVPPVQAGGPGRALAGHLPLRGLPQGAPEQDRPLHQLLGCSRGRQHPDAQPLVAARPLRVAAPRDGKLDLRVPAARGWRYPDDDRSRTGHDGSATDVLRHPGEWRRGRWRGRRGRRRRWMQRDPVHLHPPGSLRGRGVEGLVRPGLQVPDRQGPAVHRHPVR